MRSEECQKFLNDLESLTKEELIKAVSDFFDQTDKESSGNSNVIDKVKRTLLNRLKIMVNPTVKTKSLESEARKAWDDGFKTAVGYNDNYIYCVGEQRDRVWKKYWDSVKVKGSDAKAEAVTLEGEQGEPAGSITVKVHYDNGATSEVIRTSANSIYHYVRLDSPDITHKSKIELLKEAGWEDDGFVLGKMNLIMKSGPLPPRTFSIDVNEMTDEQFSEYIEDGHTELIRREDKNNIEYEY